jgi:pimeloyl-ACP methyl ester carboxylesterase
MGGMGEENVAGFRAALEGEAAMQSILERIGPTFASVTADDVAARLGNLVADVDRSAITGGAAAWLADNFRESVRNGLWGWHDDQLAFVRPWGFSVGSIRAPVAIWQGLQDRQTPYAHGEWLASHIPGVHPHLLADEGHLSLGVDSFGRILDDLLTLGPA